MGNYKTMRVSREQVVLTFSAEDINTIRSSVSLHIANVENAIKHITKEDPNNNDSVRALTDFRNQLTAIRHYIDVTLQRQGKETAKLL